METFIAVLKYPENGTKFNYKHKNFGRSQR